MSISQTSHRGEHQLWCAVISQALEDATNPPSNTSALDIKTARNWFLDAGKDFREVCSLAGMEWERVREYARRKIEEAIARGDAPKPRVRTITYEGETLTIAEWSKRIDVSVSKIGDRLKRGLPIDQVLSTEKRKTPTFTHNGETRTIAEWSAIVGIPVGTLNHRLNWLGWTLEEALTTTTEQARKKSYAKRSFAPCKKAKLYEHNGQSLTLAQWSKITGIGQSTLYERMTYQHWSIERALTTPVRNKDNIPTALRFATESLEPAE